MTITVNDHLRDAQTLSNQLTNLYNDVDFTVVSTSQDDQKMKLERVCESATDYLNNLIKNGDIIGLGLGQSILQVAKGLLPKTVRDVEVVQLDGIFTDPVDHFMGLEALSQFSQAYNAMVQLLPLPIMFADPKNKALAEQENHVRYVEKLGRVSNIAIFSIEDVSQSHFLNNDNYFTATEQQQVQDQAVGEVLSHFIDCNGNPVVSEIEQRTVSIPLENLRYKEHSMVIVNKTTQVTALATVLRSGYANEVFIDQQSAQLLLEMNHATT